MKRIALLLVITSVAWLTVIFFIPIFHCYNPGSGLIMWFTEEKPFSPVRAQISRFKTLCTFNRPWTLDTFQTIFFHHSNIPPLLISILIQSYFSACFFPSNWRFVRYEIFSTLLNHPVMHDLLTQFQSTLNVYKPLILFLSVSEIRQQDILQWQIDIFVFWSFDRIINAKIYFCLKFKEITKIYQVATANLIS